MLAFTCICWTKSMPTFPLLYEMDPDVPLLHWLLAPEAFENRTAALYEGIDLFRHLWGGGSVPLRNGVGSVTETRIFPLPRQLRDTAAA